MGENNFSNNRVNIDEKFLTSEFEVILFIISVAIFLIYWLPKRKIKI